MPLTRQKMRKARSGPAHLPAKHSNSPEENDRRAELSRKASGTGTLLLQIGANLLQTGVQFSASEGRAGGSVARGISYVSPHAARPDRGPRRTARPAAGGSPARRSVGGPGGKAAPPRRA